MSKVSVKICGLTRGRDVKHAVACGADAIGFVFARSPRRISPETARRLGDYVPEGVLRVGLFMDQDRSEIKRVLDTVPLDVLQFHGSETGQECSAFGLPWLKAVAMEDAGSVERAEINYPGALGLLLDSHTTGQGGGSGKIFDWSLSGQVSTPIWLAGGLNAENVSQAIRAVRPFAVDVSSGVESAPGIKDSLKVSAFIEAVRKAENEVSNGGKQ